MNKLGAISLILATFCLGYVIYAQWLEATLYGLL
jgi:hypothetical protein